MTFWDGVIIGAAAVVLVANVVLWAGDLRERTRLRRLVEAWSRRKP